MNICECKINKNELIDIKSKGSYLRLHNFKWDRGHLKKPIMTVPYNVIELWKNI